MTAPHPHTSGLSVRPRCGWPGTQGHRPGRRVDPQLIVEFSVGDDMPQRLNFEGLELFAGLHHEGRVGAGICDHADDARTPCPWPSSWACQRSVRQRHPVNGPLRRA
jgi:hypothetical protein